MFSLGITGVICSGKTQFSTLLKTITGAAYFNADDCVDELLRDSNVLAEIIESFGKSILDNAGEFDRTLLRKLVFTDDSKRKLLESILHPKVWAAYGKLHKSNSSSAASILLADIPLIYETQSQIRFDAVAVVASSAEVQIRRLVEKRDIPADLARKIILSQLPQTQKILLADYVVWNDGSLEALKMQTEIFAENLSLSHG
ncbi:MAG: dephospho-CoA kinase [Chthoniobacterales bacterium]